MKVSKFAVSFTGEASFSVIGHVLQYKSANFDINYPTF